MTPCSDKKGEDFKCGQNLDTIGDSLDLNIDPRLGNICMDLNEVSGDDGDLQYTDINEKTDTPPPCLVRPSSNSINTARQISGFNDELKLITSTSHDDNRRNSAATVIQKFWRLHRRRYLAAEAVMYRLLDNQKRRLSKQNMNNSRPIHSVLQSRQNELKQKRKKQHQNAIKENRSTKSSQSQEALADKAEVNDVSESILVSGNQKDRTNEDKSNILNKPIFTTNANQCKTYSPDIHITTTTEQNVHNEIKQFCRENNSLCETEFCGLRKDGNNRALGQQKNVSGEKNMSAVDNILQELKQLESVEFLNYCSMNDQCIDVSKQVSLQKCPIPTTWSEMGGLIQLLTISYFDVCVCTGWSENFSLNKKRDAALAFPILPFMSASDPPRSSMLLPRYVNVSTSSRDSQPSEVELVFSVLYLRILLFPLCTVRPTDAEAAATLVVSICICSCA
ncbi:unnamed protein product [Schistosoma mattheei]|uniref:Uncharacterized protein n=1 Tax=Schistosoma mattheei TaxID=31246 RepID=A0A3P7XKU1_9TREM|nr:unnamed protein product [Schistosoma mattheei]